jgi:8-oxo-dGTP pyrophosphatase MutT (NUDIX family)
MRLIIRRTSRAYLILEYKNDVLLVKNWLSRQKWQLPGGGIGRNENPKSAILRELNEELGIQITNTDKLKFVTRGRWKSDNLRHEYYIFTIKLSTKPKFSNRALEIIEAKWINRNQLKYNSSDKELLEALRIQT